MTTTTSTDTKTSNGKARRKRSAVKRSPDTDAGSFRERLKKVIEDLDSAFVGRRNSLGVISLAMLTRNNFLLIGDPGTAKTALVERFVSHIRDSKMFATTCGTFTTLDEINGPPDIKSFQAGVYKRVTDGMLPTADFAFLDEVMKSNDGTINSLLTILNERKFEGKPIPLWCVGSATNWPEIVQRTEKVEALYDRFVLRHHVECTSGTEHTEMLKASRKVASFNPSTFFTIAELEKAREEVSQVEIPDSVFDQVTDVVKRLKAKDVLISDRRSVKALNVMQASAWIHGRDKVSPIDFDALRYVFWVDRDDIAKVEAVLDTIDQQIVNRVVQQIDNIVREARNVKNGTHRRQERVVKAAVVMRNCRKMTDEVQPLKGQLSPNGEAKVRRAMNEMKAAYEELVTMTAKSVE